MRLTELARQIGAEIEGDGEVKIGGLAGLAEAGPSDLSFLSNAKYARLLENTRAAAVVVPRDWQGDCPCPVLRAHHIEKALVLGARLLARPSEHGASPGIHPSAVVDPNAKIGSGVCIGPYCVVSSGAVIGRGSVLLAGCFVGVEALVGNDCLLRAHAVVRERVKIGDRVILHESAVVGSDGFGNYLDEGRWEKIPHFGTVEVGDDVEIGANTTIDRARFGATVIGCGARIDNLVQIAHNVRVGDHVAMAAQTGVAGSSIIGARAMLGGQVGVAGHLVVGDGAVVGAQAGVSKNVQPGAYVTGYPAMPHRKAAEAHAHLMRLPSLKDRVKNLEARLAALEGQADGLEPDASLE